MSVLNAKEKGLLFRNRKGKRKRVQRQKSKRNFCCCRMASGGWERPPFYRTRSSTRREGEKTSECLVRMCTVLFQHVLGWCQSTNCMNTPYGTTHHRVLRGQSRLKKAIMAGPQSSENNSFFLSTTHMWGQLQENLQPGALYSCKWKNQTIRTQKIHQ